MNDMFAPALPAESVLSDRLRVHPVIGDRMCDTLRSGYDYVLLAPVDGYSGEGIYLVFDGIGLDLFRVSPTGNRQLRLSGDNKHYKDHIWTLDLFNEHVLGIVVADIKVRDEHHLRKMMAR